MIVQTGPGNATSGQGIPNVVTVQAGSAADLQRLVNEELLALAASAPTSRFVGYSIGGAGDGSQFAATILYGTGTADETLASLNFVVNGSAVPAPLLGTFDDATDRSLLLIAGGGTAEEATAALRAAINAAKDGSPPLSGDSIVVNFEIVGSANGAQWIAHALLFAVTLPP